MRISTTTLPKLPDRSISTQQVCPEETISLPVLYKAKVFEMTAIPTLLYGSETWARLKAETQRFESRQNRCMRYILGIRYSKRGNVYYSSDLRRKCTLQKIGDLLRIRRLRWFGHAARMGNERLPTKMLTTQRGRECSVGRPRTSWRRVIRVDLDSIESYDYPV